MYKSRVKEAIRRLNDGKRDNLRDAANIWKDGVKEQISIQGLGMGQPSAPGQPPRKQSGKLFKSLRTRVRRDRTIKNTGSGAVNTSELGSTMFTARMLEKGTIQMEPRPYVQRGLRARMKDIHQALGRKII